MKLKNILFLFVLIGLASFTQEKKSTKTDNVTELEREFVFHDISDVSHKIWVYLPPDYNETKKDYPVIYMHDGQNLFDDKTAYIGEWNVDETLNAIFEKTGKGFIVIGIQNGRESRIAEYTPWPNEKYGGGKGDYYIDFIVKELKPYIDVTFRTKRKAKDTGIIGSSLGGLISYYGGLKHPEVFGKVGALSSSFWFSENVNEFTVQNANQKSTKLYMLVGGEEGEDMLKGQEKSKNLLLENGFKSKNLKTKLVPDGTHSEGFWKAEFEEVVTWLFNIK